MKVLVGSENSVKIQSVKEGFLRFFEHVEVEGISVDTGVPHQPKRHLKVVGTLRVP